MNVRFDCEDEELRDGTVYAIQELYSGLIALPIHITFSNKLSVNTGLHGISYDDKLGKNHDISLSLKDYNYFARGLSNKMCLQPWKELYSEHRRKKYPQLCWYCNIITHELHHAWQSDLEYIRYEYDKIDKRRKHGLSPIAFQSISEYDAEVHAKKNCNKMFSLIKKGFKNG